MAEELTSYLKNLDIKVAYLHSEIKTLQRLQIIKDLRSGKYDVLVGINLLREGLDIPEARNSNGHVIMYADYISDAMEKAINETKRRRSIQEAYNKEHNITPTTIKKEIREVISNYKEVDEVKEEKMTKEEKIELIMKIEEQMKEAAKNLEFERATELRDILFELKGQS